MTDYIRERHVGDIYCGFIDPYDGLVDHGYADECDARQALDERDAARTDADRLAEALRLHRETPTGRIRKCLPECVGCAALHAHEEATK